MPTTKATAKKTTTRKPPARKTAAKTTATRKASPRKGSARKSGTLSKREYADLRKAADKLELEAGRMAGRTALMLEKVAADLDKSYQKSDAAKVVKQLEKQLNAWGKVAERELKKVEKALQTEFATVAKGFTEAKAEVGKSAAKAPTKKAPAKKSPARKTTRTKAATSSSKTTARRTARARTARGS